MSLTRRSRLVSAAVGAAALLLSVGLAAPAHADAANPCNVTIKSTPGTLVLKDIKEHDLHVTIGYDEACVMAGTNAAIDLQLIDTVHHRFAYDVGVTAPQHEYDNVGFFGDFQPGTYDWTLITVTKADGTTYTLPDQVGVVARDASKTRLTAKRSSGKTTLSVKVTHFYAISSEVKDTVGYKAWSGASVRIQEKSGSKWKTVRTVKSNSKGVATVSLKTGTHTYRAVSATGTLFAGSTSSSIKK